MNYLHRELAEHENSLTYPDRIWLVMYLDLEDWSEPTTDRNEAEQEYWSAKDSGEQVEFGYTYEGRFTGRYIENVKEFRKVTI